MSDHTYKIIEIVGSSTSSSDDAVRNAVAKASESVKNLRWVEVQQVRAHIEDNSIHHWQAVIKIGFTLED